MLNPVRIGLLLSPAAMAVALMMPDVAAAAGPNSLGTGPARVRMLPSTRSGRPVVGRGYFELTARPGSTVHAYVSIANEGGKSGTIRIVPVDAKTGVYGGVSYDLPQARRVRTGRWIVPARRRLTLAPRRSRVVGLTVRVPRHARPGEHIGGLTAFVPTARAGRTGFGSIQVQLRVVTAVVIMVPGPARTSLRVSRLHVADRASGSVLLANLVNNGRRLTKATLALHVVSPDGGTIINRSLPVDTTVPGTTDRYPVAWPGSAIHGTCTARASVTGPFPTSTWSGSFPCGPSVSAPPLARKSPVPSSVGPGMPLGAPMIMLGGLLVLMLGVCMGLSMALFRRRAGPLA